MENQTWQHWLTQEASTASTKTFQTEAITALKQGSVLSPLFDKCLLCIEGSDAASFLQNQFSNDILLINSQTAQYSAYSSAKGRMLANFLIFYHADKYYLLINVDLADSIIKRLSMYILRAKVTIHRDKTWCLFGVNGPEINKQLENYLHEPLPDQPLKILRRNHEVVIKLPGVGFYYFVNNKNLPVLKTLLNHPTIRLIPNSIWQWRDIDAGIPWISQATQEAFVPQMANMELIGAISFKKGCYPGQEIVARTQYLGKIKRRLYKIASREFIEPGKPLFSAQDHTQSVGIIVNICQVAQDAFEGLAVIQNHFLSDKIFSDTENKNTIQIFPIDYFKENKGDN